MPDDRIPAKKPFKPDEGKIYSTEGFFRFCVNHWGARFAHDPDMAAAIAKQDFINPEDGGGIDQIALGIVIMFVWAKTRNHDLAGAMRRTLESLEAAIPREPVPPTPDP